MKLSLPEVTLVMTDTRCHDLARLAVLDCMEQIDFGEVLICSDANFNIPGTTFYYVEDWPNKDTAQEFLWREVPALIYTSHFLFCEWDAWILNAGYWHDSFMHYDFIGAPWSWLTKDNVGNGGFSLRSTRMARHVADNPEKYPIRHPFIHDQLLCQNYRSQLEAEGFIWAPEQVARKFAFETRHDMLDTFGFHGMFNWPLVISGEKLRDRVQIARNTMHIIRTQSAHLERLP